MVEFELVVLKVMKIEKKNHHLINIIVLLFQACIISRC